MACASLLLMQMLALAVAGFRIDHHTPASSDLQARYSEAAAVAVQGGAPGAGLEWISLVAVASWACRAQESAV